MALQPDGPKASGRAAVRILAALATSMLAMGAGHADPPVEVSCRRYLITVDAPGHSPEAVESGITIPLEKAIVRATGGVEDEPRVRSNSWENRSQTFFDVTADRGTFDALDRDLQEHLARVASCFPPTVGKPNVSVGDCHVESRP